MIRCRSLWVVLSTVGFASGLACVGCNNDADDKGGGGSFSSSSTSSGRSSAEGSSSGAMVSSRGSESSSGRASSSSGSVGSTSSAKSSASSAKSSVNSSSSTSSSSSGTADGGAACNTLDNSTAPIPSVETIQGTAPIPTQGTPSAGTYNVTDMKVYTSLAIDAGGLLTVGKEVIQISPTSTGFTLTAAIDGLLGTGLRRVTVEVTTSVGGTPQATLVCGSAVFSGFQYSVVSSNEVWIFTTAPAGTSVMTLKKP